MPNAPVVPLWSRLSPEPTKRKAMEITPVRIVVDPSPEAFRSPQISTFGKNTIVINNQSILTNIEAHPICQGIVCVLDEFVG